MLASPSAHLFRASSRTAAARSATRTARQLPPLRPPAPARSRAVPRNGADAPGGDHGDDKESEKANNESGSGGEENSPPTPPPPPPTPATPHPRRGRPSSRDTARALEALRGPAHQKIGAEYGEGFVQFRAGAAQPLSLDVDALNERLSPSGALRLRRALVAPDEAHGVRREVFFSPLFFCLRCSFFSPLFFFPRLLFFALFLAHLPLVKGEKTHIEKLKKRKKMTTFQKALFSFEGVIADTRAAQAEAWRRVSSARALSWPPPEVSLWGRESESGGGEERSPNDAPAPSAAPPSSPSSPSSSLLLPPRVALVCSLRPERAITEVLQWTRDYGLAGKIAAEVAHEYLAIVRGDDDDDEFHGIDGGGERGGGAESGNAEARRDKAGSFSFSSPRPGVARWLSALRSSRVPSTIVTSLDRETLLAALGRMGLIGGGGGGGGAPPSPLLLSPSSFVTAEDGAESLAQSLLAGALKLGRPPNACCAFVASPAGVAAAHNASMRAVAVCGLEHSAHELRSADATVARLDELAVIQVRRLFSGGGGPEGTPGAFMGKQKERAPGAGGGAGGDGSWFDPDADAAARRQSRRRRVAGGVMEPPPEAAPGGGGGGGSGRGRGRGWGEDDDGGDWRRRR